MKPSAWGRAAVALAAFAAGYALASCRPPAAKPPPGVHRPAHEWGVVTVRPPGPGERAGAIRRLRVVHVLRHAGPGSPAQGPPTDPAKTWLISLGRFDDPDWASVVAVEP